MEAKRMSNMKSLIVILLSVLIASSSFAQNSTPQEEKTKTVSGPRKQLATIIFAGLGGAVLGLSTLSFYGRPQDNLSNIAIGFAVGVITGTAIVTYRAATNPAEFYGTQFRPDLSVEKATHVTSATDVTPLKINYTFTF
jgi:hypothetical protein